VIAINNGGHNVFTPWKGGKWEEDKIKWEFRRSACVGGEKITATTGQICLGFHTTKKKR
jgi:hypothetical protein